MILYDYQQKTLDEINQAWADGHKNALAVLPTGAGKTIIFTRLLAEHNGVSFAIAHRQELVTQMSITLAKQGILHNIIAPTKVVKAICKIHMDELGACFFSPSARCYVAGVDTLIRRIDALSNLFKQCTFWVVDEGHHVIEDNKWGKVVALFTNAKGLLVTATPERTDGKGLGRHHDGVVDIMIEGPTMRTLINQGYLTDYRIFAPETTIDYEPVNITASGELNQKKLTQQTEKSTIIGDIVEHYLKIAPGLVGITFLPSIKLAKATADKFNAAGVPAVALDAKTPDRERVDAIRRLKNRELLQLVNVDLFSEGFDLPAIEVMSMGRKTMSYGWLVQAFGRPLRLMEGKQRAIIIDHVGNIIHHGLPDSPRVWTLDRRDRKSRGKSDAIPVTVCANCTGVYEKTHGQCPYCFYKPVPINRVDPKMVAGDLLELDQETLSRMRGEVAEVDRPDSEVYQDYKYMGEMIARTNAKRHRERQGAQTDLRDLIKRWGDARRAAGYPDSESYRYFFCTTGVDVMTAQSLKKKETIELTKVILEKLYA